MSQPSKFLLVSVNDEGEHEIFFASDERRGEIFRRYLSMSGGVVYTLDGVNFEEVEELRRWNPAHHEGLPGLCVVTPDGKYLNRDDVLNLFNKI